jgi:hypothetical protein
MRDNETVQHPSCPLALALSGHQFSTLKLLDSMILKRPEKYNNTEE